MKTTNEYLTKIRQFKQQFAEKYGIISIGIFGSVARGEQHEESDLDVFVELKDPDPFIMFDIKEELERYSIIRTVTAVERADVVLVVIDATEGVTEQDAKIAGIAHERGKGMIIAVNKWDAIEKNDKTIYRFQEKIRNTLSFMPYAEILFISAKSGQRLNKIFEMIDVVIENNSMRVATGVLNEIVTEAVAMQQPPTDKGKRLKIYYVTQVAVKPPTFVVFVNDKNLMHFSYTRYLENRIRETFGFRGTALKFITRERKED